MINIFNLFLTLFFFWLLFSYSNDSLSWGFIIFGLASSIAISLMAWKMKIISKYNSFLFLHIGFYKHFLNLILSSFLPSLKIALRSALASPKIHPKTHFFAVPKINSAELVLLISTINMMKGLSFVQFEDQKIIISSLCDEYMKGFDIEKIIANIDKINDSRLV